MIGVPTNPVLMWNPPCPTRCSSRSPARADLIVVLEQLEDERDGDRGRGVAHDAAGRADELVPGTPASHARRSRRSASACSASAQERRGLRKDSRRPDVVRRRHQVPIGVRIARALGRCGGIEPVAELEALVPQPGVTGQTIDEVDPRAHAVVLIGQDPGVAVVEVHRPRHDHRGISPRRRREVGESALHPGHEVGDVPLVRLLGCQVAKPAGERSVGGVQAQRRRREDLDVAGPSDPLVALRAVRRQVDEVVAHAPHDVRVQLVEPCVRASRTSRCAACRCAARRLRRRRPRARRPSPRASAYWNPWMVNRGDQTSSSSPEQM